ncbi:hypothetical protein LPJ63_003797 [Coemansia sp. RSA 2711]|nr:hypothetical protein LPJ63_003797 [Coemansia sp. RSA 2711]
MSSIDQVVAQSGLCLATDPTKGRRAVATRSFRRGDPLLAVRPLVALPLRDHESPDEQDPKPQADPESKPQAEPELPDDSRCLHCFRQLPRRRARCSQCHAALYCSAACLNAHWRARHYAECQRTSARAIAAAARRLKPAFRAHLRMAAALGAALHPRARQPPALRVQLEAWRRLVDHHAEHPAHVLRQYEEIARLTLQHSEHIGPLAYTQSDDVVRALCRAGCNNFAALEPHAPRTSGVLCSPLVSLLLNHSCAPNAAFVFADGLQTVRALADIAPGDEVCLAYVDPLTPRRKRREHLAAVYFFDCACAKCAGPDSCAAQIDALMDREPGSQMPALLPTDYALPPQIEPWALRAVRLLIDHTLTDSREPGPADALLDSVLPVSARDFSFTAYTHWLECQDECLERMRDGPADARVSVWACVAASYVLAFYVASYPPYYALVGFQCLELAKLVSNTLLRHEDELGGCAGALEITAARVRELARCALSVLGVSAVPAAEPLDGLSIEAQVALLLEQHA